MCIELICCTCQVNITVCYYTVKFLLLFLFQCFSFDCVAFSKLDVSKLYPVEVNLMKTDLCIHKNASHQVMIGLYILFKIVLVLFSCFVSKTFLSGADGPR